MTLLVILGMIALAVGGIWLIVAAFQTSLLWGLGTLLLPLVGLFFVILHWSEAKYPFLLSIVGLVLVIIGTPSGETMPLLER